MTKIVTQNFGNEDAHRIATYEKLGGYKSLRKALGMQPKQIVDEVLSSNLTGRGGAGFPAGRKWSFIPKDAETIYLVVNADEGEPGTFKDRWLMHWDPHRLIEGSAITSFGIRCHTCYIYIRGELVEVAERLLQKAIDEAYDRGYLGKSVAGSGWALDMVLHRGAGAYICGEETSLLNSLEGRRGWPRLKPPFPAIKGLFGEPTVVNNVETLMNVPTIIEKGGKWFADLGVENDGGTRAVAVSGHVKNPGVHEIPVGTSLKSIVYDFAGGMRGDKPLKAVIPGGSSFPVLTPAEIDVPYCGAMMGNPTIRDVEISPGVPFLWAGGKTLKSGPGSGAIVVMEEGTDMVQMAWRIVKFYAHESCGQCTPCREGSGWLAQVLDKVQRGDGRPEDIDLIANVAKNIGGNTICALGDAVTWPTLAFLTKFRDEFVARVNG